MYRRLVCFNNDLPILTAVYWDTLRSAPCWWEAVVLGASIIPATMTVCNGRSTSTVNVPDDPPPAPGSLAAGPCIRTGRISVWLPGSDRMMPGEQHALISTSVATPGPERKRAKRLSLRTAMFGLAFSRWATVRRLDQFARQRYGKRVIHLAVLAPMPPVRRKCLWQAGNMSRHHLMGRSATAIS